MATPGYDDVYEGDDGPMMRATITGELAALVPDPVQEFTLVPVDQDLYATREPDTQTWVPVTFYSLPTGESYMHFGARATPKTG